MSRLRTQLGAVPDHRPLAPHSLILSPFVRTNPSLHLYVAVEPTAFPVRNTLPFLGESKFPHFAAARKRAFCGLEFIFVGEISCIFFSFASYQGITLHTLAGGCSSRPSTTQTLPESETNQCETIIAKVFCKRP